MRIIAYIAAIAAANFATANWAPLTFEWLGQFWVVTWGTFFIAATFFLRDTVQLKYGRRVAYYALAGALAVNVVLSFFYGDLIWVTVGSAAAFLVSETLDTEVFTRYHASLRKRVLLSGVLGGTIDSAVFAVIGLSPLTTGIVPWEFLWTSIVAQVVVKCGVQVVAAGVIPWQRLAGESA